MNYTVPPLTDDAVNMAEIWLPAFRKERDSWAHMGKASFAAVGKKSHQPLVTAWMAVEREWFSTVEQIRRLGGLLLCV